MSYDKAAALTVVLGLPFGGRMQGEAGQPAAGLRRDDKGGKTRAVRAHAHQVVSCMPRFREKGGAAAQPGRVGSHMMTEPTAWESHRSVC